MLAETVYNVYQALPETEKQRLHDMLEKERKALVVVRVSDDGILNHEQSSELIMKQLTDQKNKRVSNDKLEVVK